MKNIKMAAIVAFVWMATAANAFALTIKSGEVLTSDGTVAKASETENGKRKLAQDGVLIAGGVVYIDLNGTTIEVDVNDIRGKSKEQIGEIIGEAAVQQLTDLHDDAVAHAAEIVESGEVDAAIVAVGKTAEEIANEIMNSDAVTGAVVGVSEATHAAIQKELEKEIVCDAGGCYNPNVPPAE